MNGRWKKNGIEIELSKKDMAVSDLTQLFPQDRLMGLKIKRVVGRADSMIEHRR